LLSKLGYKPGTSLGKSGNDGPSEPIRLAMKEDRSGIGLDSERKRKVREEMERVSKKVKGEEIDYRERVRMEREEKRLDGQIHGAQKIAEKFDSEADEVESEDASPIKATPRKVKPLSSVNVLWRGLARHRLEKERDRRMRYDLQQSLSRLPTYEDFDDDDGEKQALGRDGTVILVEELEADDPELEEFNDLSSEDKLNKLVVYLRETYQYCFWCKYQYPDPALEGCPGLREEDHD
jgi:Domain of unknown function (DUF4187)/G-patch domain